MSSNYKLTRTTKQGNINKKHFLGPAVTVATLGVITLCSIFNEKDSEYKYDSNYSTYSQQIEDMDDVDISSSLETQINKLQEISLLVDEYQNDDVYLDKSSACEKLIGDYDYIVDTSLGILKNVIADEYGGEAENIKLCFEKSDCSWLAYGDGLKSISLSGNEFETAEAIGQFQNHYSIEQLSNSTQGEINDYVSECGHLVNKTVSLVADKAPKAK